MRFYGREEELSTLRSFLNTVQRQHLSQMVSVIGRRRVGKTTLILKAFENQSVPVLYLFSTRNVSEADLVKAWLTEICQVFSIDFEPSLNTLSEVIRYVLTLSKNQECVCIIDEFQDIKTVVPSFFSELQKIWDIHKNKSQTLLVLSGSIISAMEEIFNESSQPLYGRPCGQLIVQPFQPSVIQEIVLTENIHATPLDVLTVYAITGGVARYLEILADENCLTSEKALRFIFSARGGWLRSEGSIFLSNEYRIEAPTYMKILKAIASGSTKWNEIQNQSSQPISSYIKRLEEFRLVTRCSPIFSKPSARNARYMISDPYMRFCLLFVDPVALRALAEASRWDLLIVNCQAQLPNFLGFSLERWFRTKYLEKGSWFEVGNWWDRSGQNEIDLIAVNHSERRIEFAEVKLNSKKFSEKKLQLKVSRFLEAHPSFIDWHVTTKGLSPEDMFE